MSRIANRPRRNGRSALPGSPAAAFYPADDDPDDWEDFEPDPNSPIWDPQELENDEEAEPEPGDFWPDRDDFYD